MTLNKSQWALIAGAVVLFGVLYFGCDTTPPEIKDSEKSRSINIEATSVQKSFCTKSDESFAVVGS